LRKCASAALIQPRHRVARAAPYLLQRLGVSSSSSLAGPFFYTRRLTLIQAYKSQGFLTALAAALLRAETYFAAAADLFFAAAAAFLEIFAARADFAGGFAARADF
jgi:ABC-type Mn2+/Zn2+ transport system permease subunit